MLTFPAFWHHCPVPHETAIHSLHLRSRSSFKAWAYYAPHVKSLSLTFLINCPWLTTSVPAASWLVRSSTSITWRKFCVEITSRVVPSCDKWYHLAMSRAGDVLHISSESFMHPSPSYASASIRKNEVHNFYSSNFFRLRFSSPTGRSWWWWLGRWPRQRWYSPLPARCHVLCGRSSRQWHRQVASQRGFKHLQDAWQWLPLFEFLDHFPIRFISRDTSPVYW